MYLLIIYLAPHNQSSQEDKRDINEKKYINKSMFILGNVIEAISNNVVPPYRSSLLTYLLKTSFGGNCYTSIIFNCSDSLYEEEVF